MTTTTYTPREGSVVSKVIAFLAANPDEQLDADLISAKCDCDRRNVHTLLGQAVQAGLLHRAEDPESGELIYTLGPARAQPANAGFHSWLERKGQQSEEGRAKRKSPAPPYRVDIATISVEKNVPMPGRRLAMDWTPLFDQLEVGDSFAVPYAARSSIGTAVKAYKDATRKALACRTLGTEIRVWRTA